MIYKSKVNYLKLSINGRIEAIAYDTLKMEGKNKDVKFTTKSVPTITVNNVTYTLLPNLSFKENVQIGDSIIKLKRHRNVKIIKQNDKKVMVFKF